MEAAGGAGDVVEAAARARSRALGWEALNPALPVEGGAEAREGGWMRPCAEGALQALVAACSPCPTCTSTATRHASGPLPAPQPCTGKINLPRTTALAKGLGGPPISMSSPTTPSYSSTFRHALPRGTNRGPPAEGDAS